MGPSIAFISIRNAAPRGSDTAFVSGERSLASIHASGSVHPLIWKQTSYASDEIGLSDTDSNSRKDPPMQ